MLHGTHFVVAYDAALAYIEAITKRRWLMTTRCKAGTRTPAQRARLSDERFLRWLDRSVHKTVKAGGPTRDEIHRGITIKLRGRSGDKQCTAA